MLPLLAERVSNATRFVEGLTEGDPVAWVILGGIVVFSAFGLYKKFSSF
jgi:hypothetical protein